MRFKKLVALFLFEFFLFNTTVISATTYHVSILRGNDKTGTGTETNPWKTINKGQSMLAPGDTLLVHEGVYRESIQLKKTLLATKENPTLIQAANKNVILDGSLPLTGWTQCTKDDLFLTVQGVIHPNYTNIYWARIHQDNMPFNPATSRRPVMLLENGVRRRIARYPNQTKTFGLSVYDPTHGVSPTGDDDTFIGIGYEATHPTTNTYVRDNDGFLDKPTGYWDGAWIEVFTYSSNSNVERRTISSYTNADGVRTANFDAVLQYGSLSRDEVNNPPLRADTYSIVNHPHCLDTPGEFAMTTTPDEDGYYKVYLWPEDVDHLEDNISYARYGTAFHLSFNPAISYLTIDGFTIQRYNGYGVRIEGNPATQYYTAEQNRHTGHAIRNCTIQDTDCDGVQAYIASSITVENCTIRNTKDRCIMYSNGSDNIISECTTSASWETNLSMWSQTGLQISGNKTYGSVGYHGHAMTLYGIGNNTLVANNEIETPGTSIAFHTQGKLIFYGNTIISGGPAYALVTWSDGTGDIIFLNNVVLAESSNAIAMKTSGSSLLANNVLGGIGITVGSGKTITRHNNLYTKLNTGNILNTTEFDGREYSTTNLFVSPDKDDYSIITGSPLIAHGTNITKLLIDWEISKLFPEFDFTKDKAGNTWKTIPSIGAYEYTGTSTESSTKYTLTIQTRNCSVTKKVGGAVTTATSFAAGTVVELTAMPLTDFRFSRWSGDASGTDSSITITMDSNKTVSAICIPNPTEGQVFHAPLDDGSGTIVTDANHLQTGNLIDGPLWGVEWRDEDWLGFNQSTQAITIPTMGMSPQAGTIAVWVEPTDFSGMKFIFGHVLNNANRLSLYTVAGSLAVGLGANATLKTNITNLSLNQPMHLALSWEGTAYAVYVNGVQKAAGTFGGLTALNNFIDIGNYGDPAFRSLGFAGKIDDIRTYNRALAAEEIDALYLTHDVRQGKELKFTVNAVNAQGIPIVYQAADMPAGANFDAATQQVKWTPWHNQLGLYTFRFTAAGQAEKLVTVEVHPIEKTTWYGQLQTALPVTRASN